MIDLNRPEASDSGDARMSDAPANMQAGTEESSSAKLEKLRFYREEIKHEFNLLSFRVNAYITSQSFLVVAFAMSMGNLNPSWGSVFRAIFPPALAALGIAVSIQARPGIESACTVIGMWHRKQRRLFADDPGMEDFRVDRPVAGAKGDFAVDPLLEQSQRFAKSLPWIFIVAWASFGVLAVVLAARY